MVGVEDEKLGMIGDELHMVLLWVEGERPHLEIRGNFCGWIIGSRSKWGK